MERIGIDLHEINSQICILDETGEVVLETRVRTERESLAKVLGKRPRARVLIEASTESEWVARFVGAFDQNRPAGCARRSRPSLPRC